MTSLFICICAKMHMHFTFVTRKTPVKDSLRYFVPVETENPTFPPLKKCDRQKNRKSKAGVEPMCPE